MYKLFICLRYLRRRKVIYFSILGMILGIFALIVVTSVMGGFSRDLRERIRGVSSHIVITRPDRYIERYEPMIRRVRAVPHVVAASPHVEHFCHIYYQGIQQAKMVQFFGIDPAREIGGPDAPGTSALGSYLLDGKTPDFSLEGREPEFPGVLLGCNLLDYYPRKNNAAGDGAARDPETYFLQRVTLELKTLKEKPWSIAGGDVYSKNVTVVGRFRTGMVDYDAGLLYMSLRAAQEFLQIGDTVTHIAVRLDDYGRARDAVKAIEEALAAAPELKPEMRGLRILTWEELPGKRILLQAVEVEKKIQAVILFFIVLVAGFNILAIMTLIVDLKTRDIGILRSLGATSRGVSGLFLLNGALIGTIGSVVGVALGLGVAYSLNDIEKLIYRLTKFRLFPPDIYYLDAIPSEVSYPTIAALVAASMVVSLVFSLYPARKAARLDPVEAIRHE